MELHNNSTTGISNGSQRSDESGSIIPCTEAHVQGTLLSDFDAYGRKQIETDLK
jgi:hypothetical protein